MVTFGEVLAFDPEQIAEVFTICSAQQTTCSTLGATLKELDTLHTWDGDAAVAARDSARRGRVDIDAHGNETWQVAAAARDCYVEGLGLSREAKAVQTDATAAGLVIDPQTNQVSDPHPPDLSHASASDRQAYQQKVDDMQARVNRVIVHAETFDDDLAAAINTANGSLPMTPPGDDPETNQAARKANQVAAFRALYGRDPASDNDWRLAAMVDPHSYDPKNKGVSPTISVLRIKPVPGQGIVSTGLFIPGEKVVGGVDPTDPGFVRHLGDNRGFDENFSPEDTRVTYVVDYENGLVIARQNPSVNSNTGEVRVGTPEVSAKQLSDGTVAIDYKAADPFAPPGSASAGWSVNGQTIVTPGDDGARISGDVTDFPSMETYQYLPDGETNTLHRDDLGDHTEWGPLGNLPLHHEFGKWTDDLDRFPQGVTLAPGSQIPRPNGDISGTYPLGDPANPPTLPGAR